MIEHLKRNLVRGRGHPPPTRPPRPWEEEEEEEEEFYDHRIGRQVK